METSKIDDQTKNQIRRQDKIKKSVGLTWEFCGHLLARYNRDGCRESAAALTYVSLFALVPMTTLVYSVFSMIPAFQELGNDVNNLIFKYFIPESGTEIQSYLNTFSSQARKLSAVGAVILIVTSYLLLANIEKTFNNIWNTPGNRRGVTGFLVYWGVLSFGPLLVGVGLVMHTYLMSMEMMVENIDSLGIMAASLTYLPWLFTWVAFTLLFIAMPNCRVNVRFALMGGLATTVLFQLVKFGFGSIVVNSSFHTVYGAFAILPLFLLWIYICWMIILAGAEMVRSLETFSGAYRGYTLPGLNALVLICWLCWHKQQQGKSMSEKDIFQAGIEQQHWLFLREILTKNHYLEVTRNNQYIFTRDVNNVSLWQLVTLFGENFSQESSSAQRRHLQDYPWAAQLESLVSLSFQQNSGLFAMTLGELFLGIPQLDEPLVELAVIDGSVEDSPLANVESMAADAGADSEQA